MNGNPERFGILLLAAFFYFLGFCTGFHFGRHDGGENEKQKIRAELLERGMAEYYLDGENEKQFRYIK